MKITIEFNGKTVILTENELKDLICFQLAMEEFGRMEFLEKVKYCLKASGKLKQE